MSKEQKKEETKLQKVVLRYENENKIYLFGDEFVKWIESSRVKTYSKLHPC